MSRAARTSATVVTIGSSTRIGPATAARRIAASCASNSVGLAQQQADAAHAEGGVAVRARRHDALVLQRLDVLLAAPVEHADGHRVAAIASMMVR